MNIDVLLYVVITCNGDWDAIYLMLSEKIEVEEEVMERVASRNQHSYLPIGYESYPEYFRSIDRPPFILFYHGNIHLFKKPLITIMGEVNFSNVNYLKELNSYGYALLLEMTNNTESVKYLIKKKISIVVYCKNGLNYNYGIDWNLIKVEWPNTLLFSDRFKEVQSNIPSLSRLIIGHNHKILLLSNDLLNEELIVKTKRESVVIYTLTLNDKFKEENIKNVSNLTDFKHSLGMKKLN